MELRQLRYFVAVGRREHFRRAAEELNVVQPALSRQIGLLEQEVGANLFERLRRGVRLTEAGRAFLVHAERILADIERGSDQARRVARGQVGTLAISFSEAAAWCGVVPDTFAAFRATHPDVELMLQQLGTTAQLVELRERRVDAAFLYELKNAGAEVEHRLVQVDDVVLAVPSSHPLAAKRSVRLTDLAGELFILTTRTLNPQFDDDLMMACVQGGFVPRVTQVVGTSAIVISLVAVGVGLGLVPAAMRWRLQHNVTLKTIDDFHVPFRIELAWRRDNRSSILREFVALALSLASPERPTNLPARNTVEEASIDAAPCSVVNPHRTRTRPKAEAKS